MNPAEMSLLDWLLNVGAIQVPLLVVVIAGIAVAVAKWRRYPGASRLVAAGFVALALETLASTMRMALEVRARVSARALGQAYVDQYDGWILPISLLGIAGLAMIVRAIFVDRDRAAVGREDTQ